MHSLDRRSFFKAVSVSSIAALAKPGPLFSQTATKRRYRAAIIGHTGRGNYGHEMDLIFTDHPKIEVVAVADPDETGRASAAKKSKAVRQYPDYKVMLDREKPDLVAVGPRWTDQHFAMIRAALQSGAHVYSEKPFTETLAEADALLDLANERKLKIAVAHQMRLAPGILHLKSALEKGIIGDLVEMRAYGKQDTRAGGEDMLVLGVHLFDLMRFFGGDAQWCHARVQAQGHEITLADAHNPTEAIGPIAGDEIHAQFGFANRVTSTFTSSGRLRQTIGHWGIEFVGSKGMARILADVFPRIFVSKGGAPEEGRTSEWTTLEGDPTLKATAAERAFGAANRRVVDDWLDAIENSKEPACSGRAGMKAIEMVMAVYEAALEKTRVPLPLAKRTHPLSRA